MKPLLGSNALRVFALGAIPVIAWSCSMTELTSDGKIGPAGGVVTEPTSGSWLLVPAGALSSPTEVSLTPVGSELNRLDNGMLTLSGEIAIGPESVTLAKPGALTLRFPAASLATSISGGDVRVLKRVSGGAWETSPVESTRVVCDDADAAAMPDERCRAEAIVRVDTFGSFVVATNSQAASDLEVGVTLASFEATIESLGALSALDPFGFTEHGGSLHWSNGNMLQRVKLDTTETPTVSTETMLSGPSKIRLLGVDASFAYYAEEQPGTPSSVARFPLTGFPDDDWADLTTFTDAYPPPPGIIAANKLYIGRQRIDLGTGTLEDNPGALSGRYVTASGCLPSPDRARALCGADEITLSNPASPSLKTILTPDPAGLGGGLLASNDTQWFFYESAQVPRDEWKVSSIAHGGGTPAVVHPQAARSSGGLVAAATAQALFVWEGPTKLSVVGLQGQNVSATFEPLRRSEDGQKLFLPLNGSPSWSSTRDGYIGWSHAVGEHLFALVYTPRELPSNVADFRVIRINWTRLLAQAGSR